MKGIAGVLVLVVAAAILNSCRADKQDLDSVYGGDHDALEETSQTLTDYRDFVEKMNAYLEKPTFYKLQDFKDPMRSGPGIRPKIKKNLDQIGGPNLVRRSVKQFRDHDDLKKVTYDDTIQELSKLVAAYDDFERKFNRHLETPYPYKQRRSLGIDWLKNLEYGDIVKRNLDQLGGPNLVRRSIEEFKDHDNLEKLQYDI